mmetsp:Transcript_778/g.2806  ORF Transcript_778/g.2806 Transcript_778/m.2806 type:complete len:219 (+) Transcript_778:557-1213(+)
MGSRFTTWTARLGVIRLCRRRGKRTRWRSPSLWTRTSTRSAPRTANPPRLGCGHPRSSARWTPRDTSSTPCSTTGGSKCRHASTQGSTKSTPVFAMEWRTRKSASATPRSTRCGSRTSSGSATREGSHTSTSFQGSIRSCMRWNPTTKILSSLDIKGFCDCCTRTLSVSRGIRRRTFQSLSTQSSSSPHGRTTPLLRSSRKRNSRISTSLSKCSLHSR